LPRIDRALVAELDRVRPSMEVADVTAVDGRSDVDNPFVQGDLVAGYGCRNACSTDSVVPGLSQLSPHTNSV
jgi:hypothetical protein